MFVHKPQFSVKWASASSIFNAVSPSLWETIRNSSSNNAIIPAFPHDKLFCSAAKEIRIQHSTLVAGLKSYHAKLKYLEVRTCTPCFFLQRKQSGWNMRKFKTWLAYHVQWQLRRWHQEHSVRILVDRCLLSHDLRIDAVRHTVYPHRNTASVAPCF